MSPFNPDLLQHNDAQIDFILEMYSIDNPKDFKFQRAGTVPDNIKDVELRRSWADVLTGGALSRFWAVNGVNDKVRAALRGWKPPYAGRVVRPQNKPPSDKPKAK